jgi:hypothetical protein
MTLVIDAATVDLYGGSAELAAKVAAFQSAIAAHAFTVDAPRPIADPLVECIALEHDGAFDVEKPDPLPISSEVNRERDRRVAAGKSIAVPGYGDIPVDGSPTTQLNLLALKDTARDLKSAGVTDPVIPYRDAMNDQHLLTADQVIELVDAGKQYVQAIYSASWALKAMNPIPDDYAKDAYWP